MLALRRWVVWLFWTTVALGDVIRPGPTDCIAGAMPRSTHAGRWCAPANCEDGGPACPDDQPCEPRALCVVTEERRCGGRRRDCTYTHREVTGTCEDGAPCARGTCETGPFCVAADEAPAPSPAPPAFPSTEPGEPPAEPGEPPAQAEPGGCGCATPAVPIATVGLGLLPLLLRREPED